MEKGPFSRAYERRYRAYERARVRRHAVVAVLVVPCIAAFNVAAMALLGSDALLLVMAIQGTMGVFAVVASVLMRGPLRSQPAPVVATVAAVSSIASAAVALIEPALSELGTGYLLLIPLAVALLIPWRARVHLAWLAVHASIALPTLAILPGLDVHARAALAATAAVTVAVSMAGNVLRDQEDRRSFAMRSAIIARKSELSDANRALRASLRHDPLTGARNRIRMAEDLAEARAEISRDSGPWGLLAVDIDRFKAINDHFGHAAGDRVLREVVTALQEAVRPVDGVYRTGGEEFFALLPSVSQAEAVAVADRLRHAVRRLAIPNPANAPYGTVTISVGVTMVAQADLTADDDAWMARADVALYRAKAGGRNRTEAVSGPAALQMAIAALSNGGNVTPSSAVGRDMGEVGSRERHSPAALAT